MAAPRERTRRLSQRGGVDSLAGAGNVTINGDGPDAAAPDEPPQALADLVAPTGGQVLPLAPGESISRVFAAFLDDFRAAYLLQYVPQGVAAPGWHAIDIAVKRRGRFEIRGRKGYQGRGIMPSTEGTS